MATIEELSRQVGEIRRDIGDLTLESRANAGTLAQAIRTTRKQIDTAELHSSVKRIHPSAITELWDPRTGRFTNPPVDGSLIARLKAGEPVGNSMGSQDESFYPADFTITYVSPGIPSGVSVNASGLTATTTITYSGTHVLSVVVVRPGRTVTVTPTYTADDITSIHRAVA